MKSGRPEGYSVTQIALHWTVVVLVTFQYVAHAGMERTWHAQEAGEAAARGDGILAYMHMTIGVTAMALMLARFYLRWTRGVPEPPEADPLPMRLVADVVHWGIYALLVALPLTGAVAWFAQVPAAAKIHAFLTDILLYAIALHVGGALFQHYVRRSDVLVGMFRPEESDTAIGSRAHRRN